MTKYNKNKYTPLQLFAIYLKKYCNDDRAYPLFKKYLKEKINVRAAYITDKQRYDTFKHVGDFQKFAEDKYSISLSDSIYDNWYDDFLLKYVK